MGWPTTSEPPAGWYPDPAGQPGVRWWNGRSWTGFVSAYPTAPQPSPPRPDPQTAPARVKRPSRSPDGLPGSTRPSFPLEALWLALAGALGGIMVIGGLFQLLGGVFFPGNKAAQTLFGVLGIWVGFGGASLLASRRYGSGSLVADYGWRFRPVDLGYGVLGGLTCLVTASVLTTAFDHTRFAGSNTQIITSQKGNTAGVAVVTLIAAIGAPVFEELFFRGLVRQAVASHLGGVGAVWVQALLFGLVHYQPSLGLGNVSVVAGTAGVGLVLGYLTYLTGRLGADTIAHGLFNLTVTLTIIGVIR